jgi:hypothetical protein
MKKHITLIFLNNTTICVKTSSALPSMDSLEDHVVFNNVLFHTYRILSAKVRTFFP